MIETINTYHQQYHQDHKYNPAYRARRKKSNADIRKRNKDWIDNYKLQYGCSQCGYCKCARALSFHHLDPEYKTNTLSQLGTKAVSLDRIQQEVDKCIILCANCHMELHDYQ